MRLVDPMESSTRHAPRSNALCSGVCGYSRRDGWCICVRPPWAAGLCPPTTLVIAHLGFYIGGPSFTPGSSNAIPASGWPYPPGSSDCTSTLFVGQ